MGDHMNFQWSRRRILQSLVLISGFAQAMVRTQLVRSSQSRLTNDPHIKKLLNLICFMRHVAQPCSLSPDASKNVAKTHEAPRQTVVQSWHRLPWQSSCALGVHSCYDWIVLVVSP